MAKQPTLTVNVNSQQFQQFTRNFNAFSAQVKGLNTQFAQINTQLQKTNIAARAATATMNTLLNATKAVGTQVASITGHFLKWSTIIGGITALLGMGGGLFGIERLAASILAKRRLVLGLGGDYGRTQASLIYSQSLLQNPQATLQNVRMGMGGAKDQMTALMSLGIPFGTKQSPEEVMDQVLERASKIMRNAPKGTELMVAQAYGLDKLMDPMDLLRLSTEEGRKELELRRQLIEKYKDQLKISPRAAAAWSELEMQLRSAGAQLESLFGEKLADLAKPLKNLSDGFVHLVQILMRSEVVRDIIKKLGQGIEWLADKIKSLTETDIKNFIEKIQGWLPTMEQFKSAMALFVEILQGAVEVLKILRHPVDYLAGQAYKPAEGATMAPPGTTPGAATITPYGNSLLGKAYDAIHGALTNPIVGAPPSTQTTPSSPLSPSTPAPFKFPSLAPPGGGTGFKFPNLAPPGGPQSAPSHSIMWGGAASSMVPRGGGGGAPSGAGASFERWQGMMKGGGGPLAMNNWQMNRTASLVVRNVPGANVFMSAAGMSG